MPSQSAGGIIGCVAVALLAVVALPVPRAEGMCCVCRGGGCGTGFCVDSLAGADACTQFCSDAACPDVVFDQVDTCAGGCDVVADLPTATPSSSPTQTGTPSETPTATPTASFTASATTTATVTGTATVTSTSTITPTATNTPTPPQCCQVGVDACGPPTTPGFGQTPGVCNTPGVWTYNTSCNAASGECLVWTPTPTPTVTLTVTNTPTPTDTPTNTPTRTATSTVTDTPTVPMSIDPYKCYRIKTSAGYTKPEKRVVKLVDQFGGEFNAVIRPFLECNPAQRTDGTVTPAALAQPEAHLVCYKIRTEKDPANQDLKLPRKIKIRNHVEAGVESTEYYDVKKSDLVCIPSTKEIL